MNTIEKYLIKDLCNIVCDYYYDYVPLYNDVIIELNDHKLQYMVDDFNIYINLPWTMREINYSFAHCFFKKINERKLRIAIMKQLDYYQESKTMVENYRNFKKKLDVGMFEIIV